MGHLERAAPVQQEETLLVWHQQFQPLQQGPRTLGDVGACRSAPNSGRNQTSSSRCHRHRRAPSESSRGLMLAGDRGPSNPRRLRFRHSPALFLSLAAGEDPRCYATYVVGPERSAHPTPGTRRAAQQSRGRDRQGFKSVGAAAAVTQDRSPCPPQLFS